MAAYSSRTSQRQSTSGKPRKQPKSYGSGGYPSGIAKLLRPDGARRHELDVHEPRHAELSPSAAAGA